MLVVVCVRDSRRTQHVQAARDAAAPAATPGSRRPPSAVLTPRRRRRRHTASASASAASACAQGRATLEMKVSCAETPEGPQDVTLTLVLDGYNAPVSAGQFLDLVTKKFYDGMEVQRADGFVVQTGDPDGPADGYVDPATNEIRR